MSRAHAPQSGERGPSNYARKMAERDAGVRPDFEFKEQRVGSSAVSSVADTLSLEPDRPTEVVIGVIYKLAFNIGCVFLKLPDGRKVYLAKSVFRRYFGRDGTILKGIVLECEIEPHPNGKGPRVRNILSRRECES